MSAGIKIILHGEGFFLQRILVYFSTKVEKKLPGESSDHYELILGSTQMQLLGEQRLIYVYPSLQNRSCRGCYWQIAHMLAVCKGAYIPAEREAT